MFHDNLEVLAMIWGQPASSSTITVPLLTWLALVGIAVSWALVQDMTFGAQALLRLLG
jgi:hypothetical protein